MGNICAWDERIKMLKKTASTLRRHGLVMDEMNDGAGEEARECATFVESLGDDYSRLVTESNDNKMLVKRLRATITDLLSVIRRMTRAMEVE